MVSSLRDMNQRMAQWQAEKPQFDGGSELRLGKGDAGKVVIFQFVANGDDGDKYIKIYRAHVLDATSKKGNFYTEHRYCPIANGDDNPQCNFCEMGHSDIKERMSFWMYVTNIFHKSLPAEKQLEQIEFLGKLYFNETVDAFKYWEGSAWRESPWNDIVTLGELHKGLHNLTAQMTVVGEGLERRYKVNAIPNSPFLTPELYAKAQEECQPLSEMLHAQLQQKVQLAPEGSVVQNSSTPVQSFSSVLGQRTTTLFVAPGQTVPSLSFGTPSTTDTEPGGAPPAANEGVPVVAEEEERRPLRRLF